MKTFLSYKITNTAKLATRLLLSIAVCTGWIQSYSQQAKGPVQLGDQYFAIGEYYTAALLYGQFLNPPKSQKTPTGFPINSKRNRMAQPGSSSSRSDILFKQAESYRLANYWPEASAAYKESFEKNPGKYSASKYWYAVSERSLGHYAIAEDNIKQYLSNAAVNDPYKSDAEKELETLQYIRQQLARPDSVLIKTKKLGGLNATERGAYAPSHVSGNQFLVSSTQTDSAQVKGTNPNHSRLYYATISNGSISETTLVDVIATDPLINQGAATVSTDGNYLYISQWKKEKGQTVSSIYYSKKSTEGWSAPKLLTSLNSKGSNNKQPFCSPDGKYLYFSSDRAGGAGGFDIWYAELKSDGTSGEPINAGAVNTASNENAPFYHKSSGTLVFSSDRKPGMGGYDLFMAKGNEANWSAAENLGHPVSSVRDDIYFYAEENKPLLSNAIFSSDRGTGCCLETYSISKAPKAKRLYGTVRDCSGNAALANAEVVMKDKTGNSWKAVTGDDGKYFFDLGAGTHDDLSLEVSKELYIKKAVASSLSKTDESDLLINKLTNEDICIGKKPVEEKLVIKVENVVTVFFDFDKSALKQPAVDKLDSIYNVMVETPEATIQISGYTDGRGSVEYNNKLSDRRARSCAEYLIKKGIDAARITFVSFGACCPVEMELLNGRDNAEGRSKNRRALINIKKD